MTAAVLEKSEIPELKLLHRGKVRDVYELDARRLLIVATDRVSAFDFVLKPGIPGKGRLLTEISSFWFRKLGAKHHLLSTDLPPGLERHRAQLEGRISVVRRAEVVPVECVVRGYITGSGWKEYQKSGTLGFAAMPKGLREAERLEPPRFTPTTKAKVGHDEPLSIEALRELVGRELADRLEKLSVELYAAGRRLAAQAGLLIADTKFELGFADDGKGGKELLVVDELLTPDSSRYWEEASWQPGRTPEPLDKQVVRNALLASAWDKVSPPPPLADDVVRKTAETYQRLRDRLLRLA